MCSTISFPFLDPVYFASSITESPSNAFALAYQVALSANFITGLILTFLGCFGPYLLQIIPPAALLVPIAGIGFAFLGMEQITACIAAPIVGYNTIMWVFLGWYANVRVGFGGVRCPEALQVIIVGVILGWATGVNEVSAVQDAAKLVKWWGPKWVADEMFADFSTIKDFLGIVIPIGISAAATTLMCLVSAREAGDPFPVRESMIADGIGTMLAAFFGSPFGTVIYIGHPAHKRSGALTGYSCVNGCVYLILSWFGVLALMQSIVNLATIGPIVLFVGLMINEEALTFMPARHYAAFIIGLFPSIYDWVVNVSNLSPIETDDGGNAHLGSLPGWYGVLGWKRGSLLVSFVWVAMLVMVIDRQWKKATIWALVAAFFALFGIIHVPVAGFDNFSSPTWEQCVSATECWDFGQQWQFFVAYCMLAGTFAILQGIRMFLPGIKLDPEIHDDSTEAFSNWFEEAATVRGVFDIPHHTTESKALEDPDPTLPTKELTEEPIDHDDAEVQA